MLKWKPPLFLETRNAFGNPGEGIKISVRWSGPNCCHIEWTQVVLLAPTLPFSPFLELVTQCVLLCAGKLAVRLNPLLVIKKNIQKQKQSSLLMIMNAFELMAASGMKLEGKGQVEKTVILIGLILRVWSYFQTKKGLNQPESRATCPPVDVRKTVVWWFGLECKKRSEDLEGINF